MAARLELEYDGARLAGWARQPGHRTVQDELERALAQVAQRNVPATVAGRTDAGVHAWAQVVSHPGDPLPVRALNGVLPRDVVVRSSERAPDGFDARGDATSRAYCYRVLARSEPSVWEEGRAFHHPRPLDPAALRTMAGALPGRHEMTAFTPAETSHRWFTRTILSAEWHERPGDVLELWIEADAFLRHMIRIMVGTMLLTARNGLDTADFVALLDGRPRADAGPTAPPHALYFAGAGYDGERVLGGAS